ncbi:MAG: hypothetical protein ABI416_18900 [Ginsengibacter sp.]
MKRLLALSFTSSVILFSCSGGDIQIKTTEQESYKITKESLLKKEIKNPKDFLLVDGHDKRNLLGQTVVKGTISNRATVAIFKDVSIKLSFYSKTHTLLETDKETIFEVLPPGTSKNFKTKYFSPKGTDSVALEVLGAKIVED